MDLGVFRTLSRISHKSRLMAEYLVESVSFFIRQRNASHFIVSYPKCGRTWLRTILLKYFSLVLDEEMPQTLDKIWGKQHIPKFIFTHDGKHVSFLTRSKRRYRKKHIVYLSRDPRDTVVSHYHHCKERDKNYWKDISSFVRDPVLGVDHIITFMNTWYQKRTLFPSFLMISYERLRKDPSEELTKLLTFLGCTPVDQDRLAQAIEFSSFSKMKQMEQSDKLKVPGIKSTKGKSGAKVRKGKIGGYKEELSSEDVAYVDSCVADHLDPAFGYK